MASMAARRTSRLGSSLAARWISGVNFISNDDCTRKSKEG